MSKKAVLRVFGMTCKDCEATVRKGLLSSDGVLSAKVSLEEGFAEVVFDENKLRSQDLERIPVFSGRSRYRAQLREVI